MKKEQLKQLRLFLDKEHPVDITDEFLMPYEDSIC